MPVPTKPATSILLISVGCVVVFLTLTVLTANGVPLPVPLQNLVVSNSLALVMVATPGLLRWWVEQYPTEGLLTLAGRAVLMLAAYVFVPWLLLGRLEAAPGRDLAPLKTMVVFVLVGAVSAGGAWLAMWAVANRRHDPG